jgi:hypothetical protein
MTTFRNYREFWTETHRVLPDETGEPQVKVCCCCCKAPAASRRECANAAGNKTPCRCFCHSDSLDPVLRKKKS